MLVISKLLVITDRRRFCNIRETDNNHSRWQSFQFRFNSSAEIVCNQPNFNRKIFVSSRILAEFFSLRDNSAHSKISQIFFARHPYFFQIADWGSNRRASTCSMTRQCTPLNSTKQTVLISTSSSSPSFTYLPLPWPTTGHWELITFPSGPGARADNTFLEIFRQRWPPSQIGSGVRVSATAVFKFSLGEVIYSGKILRIWGPATAP